MPEYEILEDKTLVTLLWRATINHEEILFIVLQSSNNDFEKALIHYAALSYFQWEVLFLRSKWLKILQYYFLLNFVIQLLSDLSWGTSTESQIKMYVRKTFQKTNISDPLITWKIYCTY